LFRIMLPAFVRESYVPCRLVGKSPHTVADYRSFCATWARYTGKRLVELEEADACGYFAWLLSTGHSPALPRPAMGDCRQRLLF
jgi:hypothetical protein